MTRVSEFIFKNTENRRTHFGIYSANALPLVGCVKRLVTDKFFVMRLYFNPKIFS